MMDEMFRFEDFAGYWWLGFGVVPLVALFWLHAAGRACVHR